MLTRSTSTISSCINLAQPFPKVATFSKGSYLAQPFLKVVFGATFFKGCFSKGG